MLFGDIITETRRIIQDLPVFGLDTRLSDEVLAGFANQALKRVAVLRPDLFIKQGQYRCVAGVGQTLSGVAPLTRPARLVQVFRNGPPSNAAVVEVNRQSFDEGYPQWPSDPENDIIVNFMRDVRDDNMFFVYPPASTDASLVLSYVQTPDDYLANQEVELLPDIYFPAVVDATVFVAESMDDESVNSNRAQLYYQSFTTALGSSLQSRVLTDTNSGGLSDDEVT